MVSHFRPWLEAWRDTAYGPQGFWRHEHPAPHFRTASSTTPLLAEAIAELLASHRDVVGVVELGAGDGDLLAALSTLRPDLALAGIDVRSPSTGPPHGVSWAVDLWDVLTGCWSWGPAEQLLSSLTGPVLLIAAEWLDDLPCQIASRSGPVLRVVDVDDTGRERLGAPVDPPGGAWAERWWPTGVRVEIGSSRDHAWAAALTHLHPHGGLALAIDYAHLADARPSAGSLAGYRSGREVPPVPSPTLNLTAAVAFDSLAAAGRAVGADTVLHRHQLDLIPAPSATRSSDPLADLVARSHRSALLSPTVWGHQHWLLQAVPAG